jgi:CheY-like chemotaxis protein
MTPEWILFVDDEPDMEEMIRQQFRKQIRDQRFQFAFARNGRHALESLKENEEMCMVVTDINMPEMDGLTGAAKTRPASSYDGGFGVW